MKTYISIFVLFICLMLIVPAVVFIGQDSFNKKEDKPSSISQKTVSQIKDLPVDDKGMVYKVYNHKTEKVMNLSAADYIKGVVAAEMPASFHPEALKAQAVAANTYALRIISIQKKNPNEKLKGAYFSTDSTEFQAYMSPDEIKKAYGKNYNDYYKKISNAVDAVINKVIVYDDQPIVAAFHSISGGKTEASENVWGSAVSYLKPVESVGDKLSPNYETTKTISAKDVEQKLKQEYKDITLGSDKSKWFNNIKLSASKTITSIKVGNKTSTGMDIRSLFSLRSANFTVSYNKKTDSFLFDNKGYGHGVGMSQYGADYLARQGKTYDQILKYYYTGVSIANV
ncbi:MAG: stage sporulation protein [Oscillospiraceae bacterium]|nr:stage sporulation protein [Oscillospiraceae bacterium]